MSAVDELFALEIRAYRNVAKAQAARAMLNADRPLDEVQQAAHIAGIQWDDQHPNLLSRLSGAA